jgi:CRISPR/Cas system-associated exonuclease Cas4 (RecB family)
LKKAVDVELSAEEFEVMSEILNDILLIVRQDKPPAKIEKNKCRGCSYFQLCWSEN